MAPKRPLPIAKASVQPLAGCRYHRLNGSSGALASPWNSTFVAIAESSFDCDLRSCDSAIGAHSNTDVRAIAQTTDKPNVRSTVTLPAVVTFRFNPPRLH